MMYLNSDTKDVCFAPKPVPETEVWPFIILQKESFMRLDILNAKPILYY